MAGWRVRAGARPHRLQARRELSGWQPLPGRSDRFLERGQWLSGSGPRRAVAGHVPGATGRHGPPAESDDDQQRLVLVTDTSHAAVTTSRSPTTPRDRRGRHLVHDATSLDSAGSSGGHTPPPVAIELSPACLTRSGANLRARWSPRAGDFAAISQPIPGSVQHSPGRAGLLQSTTRTRT